ncbi:DUF1592 domain-containing protein [Lignipirellula cremea]|uniref:DUF1592 domain-containing protein n=1 Tax=Lignipirellula cremea TaxID=2528010 RepID=UPI0018D26A23|nr:DUF1592 domain-containing protein [Lignipirellula cremea]
MCCCFGFASQALFAQADDAVAELAEVNAILQQSCISCHGPKTSKAGLRLDQLDRDLVAGDDAELWHEVLNQISAGDMPPAEADPLEGKARQRLTAWIRTGLEAAAVQRRSTQGQVVLRRLTRYEYQHTMEDLLGLSIDFSSDLPPEAISPNGFLNNGQTLLMSPVQLETYLQAARQALELFLNPPALSEAYHYYVASHAAQAADLQQQSKGKATPGKQGKKAKTARQPEPQGYTRKSKATNVGGRDGLFIFPLSPAELAEQKAGHSTFEPIIIRPEFRQTYTLDAWPTEGEILVRVRAAGGNGQPQMTVAMGYRASGAVLNLKPLGRRIVTGTADEPQTFEFRARMEALPVFLSGKDKFRGELVTVTNESITSDLLLDSVEVIYPAPQLLTAHQVLLDREAFVDETTFVEAVLRKFVPRAFRRPVAEAEIQRLLALHALMLQRSQNRQTALRDTLAVVLSSPQFLYLSEPRTEGDARTLNDHELASRLSYLLWSTMPDDELRQLADDGKLGDPQVLSVQVKRLLADERSERFVQNFVYQWLDLGGLGRVAVNPEHFPQYNDDLQRDSAEETYAFFRHVLRHDLPALEFLDSRFVMLNDRMAKHYGVANVAGSQFRPLPNAAIPQRSGLLTQASILTANSNGVESHPIKRGVWLLRQLLNDPPPPPPPNVPQLEEATLEQGLTLSQRLQEHRNNAACFDCHQKIDPWGLTFENYDAIGRWRGADLSAQKPMGARKSARAERAGEVSVNVSRDASAVLPGNVSVSGLREMQQHLVQSKSKAFARALTENLLIYALGRSLEFTDAPAVDTLTEAFIDDGYRLAPMIERIVLHEIFRTK